MVADQAFYLKIGAEGFEEVGKKIDQVSGRLEQLVGHIKTMGHASVSLAGLGAAATTLATTFKGAIDAADSINDLSQKIGISVRDLGGWQLAAEQSGASLETIGKGIKGLAPTIGQFSGQFEKLGISVKDPSQALIDFADIFQAMPDGFEKNALAVKLFGKAGADLIPMLNQGSQGLADAREKAARYAEELARLAPVADAFNDALKELELRSKARTMGFLVEQVKGATGLIEFYTDATSGISGFTRAMDFLSDRIPVWTGGLFLLSSSLRDVANALNSDLARKAAALAGIGGNPAGRLSKGRIGGPKGLSDAEEEALGEKNAKVLVNQAKGDALRKLLLEKGGSHADGADKEANYLTHLKIKLLEAEGSLSEYGKVLEEISTGSAKKFSEVTKRSALDLASQIDAGKLAAQQGKGFDAYFKKLTDTNERGGKELTDFSLKMAEGVNAINEKTRELGLPSDVSERFKALTDIDKEFERTSRAIRETYKDVEQAFGDAKLAELEEKRAAAKVKTLAALDALKARSDELNASWEYGADKALRSYLNEISTVAASAERLFTNAFKNMEDALVQFAKTGKLDFASLADSIISDLIRIQVQQNITRPLAGMMSGGGIDVTGTFLDKWLFGGGSWFANGGIMTPAGALPLNAYAGGGIATSPQLAVFGEGSMNEAFVPLPDGRSIPVQMRGGGGGGVSISMPVTIDARGASAEVVPMIQQAMQQTLAQMRREVPGLVQRQQLHNGRTPFNA